ncbi:hypothetical protein FHX42_005251 [Saccharopolyspora lacisalsi]|uniref:PPM-type phosphatase domain-containing protein n=1 Tax=Halosaccharopolyspora lacisalsi TaxID=1000566 RepID=A0A839E1X1_9PSEU|nr:protein phosphatase 2C domain-containing protein [Halosaccharopolyspora lacisalsi]MBA8827844.1 hypothetical protein [Halosaccharopolyspora lacisalsi]
MNEDVGEVQATWALVLDGATAPPLETGCVHGVRWYVDQLSRELRTRLSSDGTMPLPDMLAESIRAVTESHASTCDTANPSSPSSTVSLVRERSGELDYLVLADSPVILDVDGEVRPVLDDRIDHLPAYDLDTVTRVRNTDAGFWVASTDPTAAYRAVSGSTPLNQVRRVALASDGATRLVDVFGLLDWAGLLDLCTPPEGDPRGLITRTRAAEDDPTTSVLPGARRAKGHDDATVIALDYREAHA